MNQPVSQFQEIPQYISVIKLSYNEMSHSTLLLIVLQDNQVLPGYPWMKSELSEHWEKRKKKSWHFYARELNPSKVMFLNMLGQAPFISVSHLLHIIKAGKKARKACINLSYSAHCLKTEVWFQSKWLIFQMKTRKATNFRSVQMGQWSWHKVLYPVIFPHTDLLPNGKEERGKIVISQKNFFPNIFISLRSNILSQDINNFYHVEKELTHSSLWRNS